MSGEVEKNERMESVIRWATVIKTTPKEVWRKEQRKFIDSQFEMHERFVEKMLVKKGGKEKLRKMYNINNPIDYDRFY